MQSVDMEPNAEEKLEKLEQDFDKPFSPPSEVRERLPKDHPSLDMNIDEHEWYDEGAAGAAEVSPPWKKNILGYNPKKIIQKVAGSGQKLAKKIKGNKK